MTVANVHGYMNQMFKEKDGVFVDAPDQIDDLLTFHAEDHGVNFADHGTCRLTIRTRDIETVEDGKPLFLTVRTADCGLKLQIFVPKDIAHNFPIRDMEELLDIREWE